MTNFLYTTVLCLILISCKKNQNPEKEPEQPEVESAWTKYDYSNSPLTRYNGITSLFITSGSNVWLAAGDLFNYNGKEWKSYNGKAMDAPGVLVKDGVPNASGELVFAGLGIQKKSGETWSIFTSTNSAIPTGTHKVKIDKSGKLLVGSNEGLMLIHDFKKVSVYTPSNCPLTCKNVQHLEIAPDGRIWAGVVVIPQLCGNVEGSVVTLKDSIWKVFKPSNSQMPSSGISCMKLDINGNLWFGSGNTLFKLENDKITSINHLNSDMPAVTSFSDLAFDKKNVLWAVSMEGILRYDGTTWTKFDPKNSPLEDKWVTNVEIDDSNNKWFSTLSPALYKYIGD